MASTATPVIQVLSGTGPPSVLPSSIAPPSISSTNQGIKCESGNPLSLKTECVKTEQTIKNEDIKMEGDSEPSSTLTLDDFSKPINGLQYNLSHSTFPTPLQQCSSNIKVCFNRLDKHFRIDFNCHQLMQIVQFGFELD